MTTALSKTLVPFKSNRVVQVIAALYFAVWIICAINPSWRPQWLLDNYLVFASVAALIFTHRKYPLSDLSFLLIAIFLALHAYGSNYGYSSAPAGFWLQDVFNSSRPNPYDRLVHFLFGFLIAYPVHEVLLRYTASTKFWRYVLPAEFILSYSAVYEIIEAAVAWILPPEQYDPFVGLQGDVWDGFYDMSCALGGAVVMMVLLALWRVRNQS